MALSRKLVAGFFTVAGIMHFIRTREYEAIMPRRLPMHREAVLISGVAEIAGGIAVLHPRTRPLARWWLLGLLAAVFPANVYMALAPEEVSQRGVAADRIPRWLLWARLPLQPLAMLWVWRATAA